MVAPSRLRTSAVLIAPLILLGAAAQPTPETAQPVDPACAATGYLVESAGERAALRGELVEQPVQRLAGVPLASGQTWVVPDGSQPVVVIDSTAPLPGGTVSVALAGREFEVDSNSFDEPGNRFVTSVWLPHLGPTVRSLGLVVDSGPCQMALALSVDRSVWSTMVGAAAVAGTVLFGLLAVWVGRLRKGGWVRRFGFAAPLGLLAGTGQAVVLMESGVVSPFAPPPWWAPAAGLALAALLPLTRWRRRAPAVPSPEPATVWQPPVHAPLGGYRVDGPFTTTEVATVYRAADDAGERALLKLLRPERYGDPSARLRLEREARALSGAVHPNVLRLRQTVSDQGGPPTLLFEDVAGAPLRQLLDGGGMLTGPQAVGVVLGVLSGLGAVHERELVHRDVRPENVWLDTGGRVLLAGFELAATGVEHPLAPESVMPYASPEQRAGQVLDGRSDVWACGMLLAELLVGRPAFPPPGVLPEPLAAVLARALAEDPGGRPVSARQFSADLWEAAEQVYGADWVGRGALAGALIAHGAVGAAVAGYALGGAAGTAGGVAGAGAGVTAAGVGGAAGTAAGAAATAGLGGTETGTLAAVPAATAPAAPVVPAGAAGATTGGGPVGAVVNAAVAVVAGIAIAAGAVLVNPEPAEARAVVITPEQAHVIFVRTMAEGWSDTFTHFAAVAEAEFQNLLEVDESLAGGELVDIGVGVPREQYEFPAWFVAWALIPFEDGTASVFARFDRESAGEPWLMTTLGWSTERLLPAAEVDEDGWLAPPPSVADLAVDPASLPERYHDWLVRANEAGEVGSDDVLRLRFDDTGMIVWFTDDIPFFAGEDTGRFSYEYEMSVGEVVTDLIPLVDGTVHVTFTSIIRQTTYNTPNQRATSCDENWLFWEDRDPPGTYRWLAQDLIASVEAWIPVVGAEPPAGPESASELEFEPVDPDTVVIEDWNSDTDNRDGDPC